MLGIDIGSDAAGSLGLGDGMQGQGGLARGFGAVDLDDATAGVAAHSQCLVQADRSCRDGIHFLDAVIVHAHDGTGAEGLLDFGDGILHHLQFHGVHFDDVRCVGCRLVHVVGHNVGRGDAQYLLPVNHHFLFQHLLSHSRLYLIVNRCR